MNLDRVAMNIALTDFVQALARGDLEAGCVQRAFDMAVFHEPLRQQRVGMRANVFECVNLVIEQEKTHLATIYFDADREIRIELIKSGNVVPHTVLVV